MILFIDTTDNAEIEVGLSDGGRILSSQKIPAERQQGEKLLPAIENVLRKKKIKLSELEAIEVKNRGGSFTSLRVGVAAANALGFALGIPVRGTVGTAKTVDGIDIVEPKYGREPDIGS
ncbi:MAG TPA: tRNA (adenosine(37)-N6)-threonylcarbamoyltransferase complex dimerization subunit type 1 TsaB [Candidatus Nanoarchaeia archaeon]|nr:tRNA (adenosine(37)-N6)-threonylcarbamoyltransferase complex dimerization subunit type 1 TsaB [Candidatus Nanoarchaeia archaeon]